MAQPDFNVPDGVQLASKQSAPIVSGTAPGTAFSTPEYAPAPRKETQLPTTFDTPESRSAAISQLMPTIRSATQKYARTTDPIVLGQAKVLISRALPRYDPQKADIKTFVDRQLQPLMRYSSRRSRKVRLPDRMQLAAVSIKNVEQRYHDEYDRPPTIRELSRETGLKPERIAAVRRADRSVISGDTAMDASGESDVTASDLPVLNDAENSMLWVNFVREDLPPVDQLILEYSLGLDGQPQLKASQIAKKLKISSAAVSQRAKRIQALLNREDELNPFR